MKIFLTLYLNKDYVLPTKNNRYCNDSHTDSLENVNEDSQNINVTVSDSSEPEEDLL